MLLLLLPHTAQQCIIVIVNSSSIELNMKLIVCCCLSWIRLYNVVPRRKKTKQQVFIFNCQPRPSAQPSKQRLALLECIPLKNAFRRVAHANQMQLLTLLQCFVLAAAVFDSFFSIFSFYFFFDVIVFFFVSFMQHMMYFVVFP